MRVFYCDHFEVELPARHRFPMQKYELLRQRLVAQGVLDERELRPAQPVSREKLLCVHDAAYVDAFHAGELDRRAQSRLGFPWSEALVQRSLASVGGTLQAARAALEDGISGHLAGGTHHAFPAAGAGYCVFNDLAVTARSLLSDGVVRRVLVVDLDVHQGDGTAAIFADDPRVFTLSVHGERNFPGRKEQSDLDVPLPDDTGDAEYLAALEPSLDQAFERSRPDLVLFQAGVDPLFEDKLGRLALTEAGLAARDRLVFERARSGAVPIAITLGGGYADPIDASIAAHVGTYREAQRSGAAQSPS